MKNSILIMALMILFCGKVDAQSASPTNQSCSVILLNDQWLIQSYQVGERAILNLSAEGIISVRETGDIFVKSFRKEKLEFSLAIKKSSGETEILFANAPFKTVKAQDVLKKCRPGDKILVLLKDNQSYSLPHYEIEVRGDKDGEDGC